MFGAQKQLSIHICKDAKEAEEKGHFYRYPIQAVEVEKVVVVQEGTTSGGSTVDLVLRDEFGNQYVVMLTGNLIKSIPC